MVSLARQSLSGSQTIGMPRDGSGVGQFRERERNDAEIAQGGPGIPYLHRAESRVHSELWRTLPKRRADQHGFCRVGGEPGHEQADGQETADAMESTGSSSAIAGSNSGVKRRLGGNLPHLVSRLSATKTECRCLAPRNLTLSIVLEALIVYFSAFLGLAIICPIICK